MMVRRRTGFTLVELLVVIAVITVLGGMLLPAVQSAREAGRMNSCRNNVAQLSKGLVHHEALLGYFPSSGWGPEWLGVAERGSDSTQPGGWVFGVLSYIEEKDLRNSIEGVTTANAEAVYAKLVTAAIPVFACPSRRTARPLFLPANRTQLKGAVASRSVRRT